MAADTVRVERRGPVTIVSIDRPAKRNAVDRATAGRLADAFRAFDADDEAAVAILRGCLRHDRASLLEQEGLDEGEAMRRELAHGQASLRAETVAGATRFASGAGRHGSFGQVTEGGTGAMLTP
jgi:enoyl-CoA hydratase/carnithine racemase